MDREWASGELPELPELADLLAAAVVVRVPLRVRFRGVDRREAMLVRGPAGWGEFAPFPEYGDEEAARWLAAAIEAAWIGPPDPVRSSVPVNATVPAVSASEVDAVLDRFDGCRTAKIKVAEPGQSLSDDLDRVAAVRDRMGSSGRLRVDANGGWSVDEARAALGALAGYRLEYAEQPCASVEELAALRVILARNGIDVPIAADESIRKADDPLRVAREQAADVIVVKVAPLGGARAALRIVAEADLPAVVSSALDTSVGIAAGVSLAAALPTLRYDCGLGTVGLFTDDVAREPLRPRSGSLPVSAAGGGGAAGSGTGSATGAVEVDAAAVARLAAPPEREAWWRARLARCHALLAAGR